ncbi:MAG: AAA family ATPase, partial [Treponema sp.]|nr:AAA family ATPase [Treponema sp.]
MLEELDIKNFALIDSAHVEFGRGFTVLSGETGAGKSILIGSLAFLLGGKAGDEQIRTGCHEAQVSGSFFLESKEALEWLSDHGMEAEDSRILLRRLIRDSGKSSAWIGGVPVTRADLLAFSAFLVDIHGQHEQQSLMKVTEHRRYLDMYAGIVPQVRDFTALYSDLVEKRRALDALDTDESQREARIEMLSFAVNEIQEAKLKPHEDEELEAEENRLSSFEKLYGTVNEINGLFDGAEGSGLVSIMRRLKSLVPHASSMDKSLESLDSRIESSFYEIEDLASEFKHYQQSLVFDPDRLAQVQDRLEVISTLKKKYLQSANAGVADILAYQEKASQELECLTGAGHDRETLQNAVAEAEKAVY